MATPVLHYLFDPLCGWCYGAAPLVQAARQVARVVPHGIGLMSGARRQAVTPRLRAFVMPHDARIAQLSGQPFGRAYADGLLRDADAVFDSAPPTAAILAAEALAGRGLEMLARLQVAHCRIAEAAVLIEEAAALGLDASAFEAELSGHSGSVQEAHVSGSRALTAQTGARGVPGLVLDAAGSRELIDGAESLGQRQAFQSWLRRRFAK